MPPRYYGNPVITERSLSPDERLLQKIIFTENNSSYHCPYYGPQIVVLKLSVIMVVDCTYKENQVNSSNFETTDRNIHPKDARSWSRE